MGQYYTLFMNVDIFPNTIDYWGPNGMVFIRNPQLRYTAMDNGGMKLGVFIGGAEFRHRHRQGECHRSGSRARRQDLLARSRRQIQHRSRWGQFQVSGILREVGYESANTASANPSGTKTGWGVNVNGQFKTGPQDRVMAQFVYGHAIASYMNDGGVDLAPNSSIKAETVPSYGGMLYYDHYWNESFSSSIGVSMHHQDNLGGQLPNAFRQGTYASTNVLWYPAKNVMTGVEFIYGKLEQFDGATADDPRLQFSAQVKY